jgi:hypothetical protein
MLCGTPRESNVLLLAGHPESTRLSVDRSAVVSQRLPIYRRTGIRETLIIWLRWPSLVNPLTDVFGWMWLPPRIGINRNAPCFAIVISHTAELLRWLNEMDEQDGLSSDLLSSDNFGLELENVDGDLFAPFSDLDTTGSFRQLELRRE